jgi:hypothetical protein
LRKLQYCKLYGTIYLIKDMFDFIVFINKAFVLIDYNRGIERNVSFICFF